MNIFIICLIHLLSSIDFEISIITMKKRGVLQLTLQFNFWVAKYTCNSLYLCVVNQQTSSMSYKVAIHCIYDINSLQPITTQSKQLIFNYYATPL